MENFMETIQMMAASYGLRILAALAIFVVGKIVAKSLRSLIRRVMKKKEVDDLLTSFVCTVSYVIMMVVIVIAAIGQLGIQTTSLVVVLGAAGLAIGFALQGSLANFASGILILILHPFKSGDFIEAAGVAGSVENIGLLTTDLKTPDNRKIIVPNSRIMGDNIINYTARDIRRMDLVVGVSYGDDLDKVKEVIEDILSSDERILKEPAPLVGVVEMANSSVNLVVRPWVKTSEYWSLFYYLQETIKKRFDAEGISIPFPQRDVHLYKSE